MFKGVTLTLVIFLLAITTGLFLYAFVFESPDYQGYATLVDRDTTPNAKKKSPSMTEQRRIDVKKQLLFKEGEDRLEWRLNSKQSTIMLSQEEGGVLEKMYGLEGIIQENSHQSLTLKAENSIYRFKTKELSAEKVDFERHSVPEQQLQFKGYAESMLIGHHDSKINIKAKHFHGQFNQENGQ